GGLNYIKWYSIEYLVFWQEKLSIYLMSLVWHKLVLEGLIPPHRQHDSTQSSNPKTDHTYDNDRWMPNLARQVIICVYYSWIREERQLSESSKSLHYFPQLC
ncbi:hypothetical protein ACJX0J_040133, partial [Zea mays]